MALFDVKPKQKKTTPVDEYIPQFIKEGQFTGEELVIAELIQRRRLQMLIHSCIYYELNKNIIPDKMFDALGKELAKLQNDYPEIASKICFNEAFIGWDGSTGFDLPLKHKWVLRKATHLLKIQ